MSQPRLSLICRCSGSLHAGLGGAGLAARYPRPDHQPRPEAAVVLCVDDKSQIQALDRTAPVLPELRRRLVRDRWLRDWSCALGLRERNATQRKPSNFGS